MFYLIMKDGDTRRWWNEEAEAWGTRQAATRYNASVHIIPPISIFTNGGRIVGPCDGTED